MELIDELRTVTRPIHTRIEQLPAARELAQGRIGREPYLDLLGRLYWVHATFEAELDRAPVVRAAWPAEAERAAAVARDLEVLGGDPPCAPPAAVTEWRHRLRARGHHAAWAGAGYVLEGSRMGSRVLAAPLARALAVPPGAGVGLDYHRDGLADPVGRWERVRAALAALDEGGANRAHITFGAVATFELMLAVHAEPVADPEPILVRAM
ncbi:biliverdin-producing heme oxygenase [Gemmata sp.]|uniref:biliverdin-producing heme oxygenase n=1 Tax=Gemmata sp. TaxID=1914242 RepID=UPI003F710B34